MNCRLRHWVFRAYGEKKGSFSILVGALETNARLKVIKERRPAQPIHAEKDIKHGEKAKTAMICITLVRSFGSLIQHASLSFVRTSSDIAFQFLSPTLARALISLLSSAVLHLRMLRFFPTFFPSPAPLMTHTDDSDVLELQQSTLCHSATLFV